MTPSLANLAGRRALGRWCVHEARRRAGTMGHQALTRPGSKGSHTAYLEDVRASFSQAGCFMTVDSLHGCALEQDAKTYIVDLG